MNERARVDESTPPKVSIVVPTFNRAPFLARLLHALAEQTVASREFEVIVVDDGSTDGTPAVLAQPYGYRLRSLTQENAGPAAARNAAIAVAAGAIVLFVDDDVIPSRDLIEQHLCAHEARDAVVFGRLCRPQSGRRQPFWAEWELLTLERQYDDMLAGRFKPSYRQFYTANASVRREDLLRAGLFNQAFRRGEDVELAQRLEGLPREIVFADDAVVVHDTPRTLGAWVRMARQYGHYDAVRSRLPGFAWLHEYFVEELMYHRSTVVRAGVRLLSGRRLATRAAARVLPQLLRALDVMRLRRFAMAGCSMLFAVLYWDEFCRELGGRQYLWLSETTTDALNAAPVE